MTELSPNQLDLSRKIERLILHALAEHGQSAIAAAIGTSESTISRLKDGNLEAFSKVLAALDLKVVPTTSRSIDPDRMRAFCTLFEAAMTRPDSLEHLLLEGEE